MIVKEAFLATTWNVESYWNGPPRNRISLEGHLHRLMDSTRHQSVIGFLGDHVDRKLRIIRIYTAYGELGDLDTLVDNHVRFGRVTDENGRPLVGNVARIPALVIICLCEAMAASVCLMAHGQLPDDQGQWAPRFGNGDGPNPPWTHNIIHRDIKPSNYFLTECRHPRRWTGLPIAALGDFGNAFDATHPPDDTKGMGTPGYQAPEQEPNSHHVTSATNVFQVGLVMHELMTLSGPSHQASYQSRNQPLFPDIDVGFYPQGLAMIARHCIRSDIHRRPSPKKLYLMVRNLANGMVPNGTPQLSWCKLKCKSNMQ
jgi:serine/threonine protein kinase